MAHPKSGDAGPPLPPSYRGRFAPSPTGPLHLGSLLTAVASYLDARHAGGEWLLRIENIDPARESIAAEQQILLALEQHGLPWGIVTNKIARFSVPLVEGLGLMPRCAVLISGDSTAHAKPHPAPLLEAARRLDVPPQRCIYIGDDRRDVEAGRGARMPTLAAAWGYLGRGESVHDWNADAVLQQPDELLNWLGMP